MLKKLVTLVLVATLSINASCGTLTGWTRNEPFKEAVIIGNTALLFPLLYPGVIGFIVDGYNGKLNRQTTQQPTEQNVETTVEESPLLGFLFGWAVLYGAALGGGMGLLLCWECSADIVLIPAIGGMFGGGFATYHLLK